MSVITVCGLTRDYGSNKGIFDINFSIEKGEVFGFLGPNGAGKTTTIRHLMGFLKPQQGSCTVSGLDCRENAAEIQKNLGYIPGEIALFDDMSGIQYLRFMQEYRGIDCTKRMNGIIQRFELDPNLKIKKMSKGMKQKIAIAAAFMHDPDILILDEPTSGLDPLMQNRFIELIKEEKQRGKTVLMSSHMFEEVEKTCDRIGIIKDGRMVADDGTEALKARYTKSYTVTLGDKAEAAAFARDFHGTVKDGSPNEVVVTAKQTLEEIFLHYYGEEESL